MTEKAPIYLLGDEMPSCPHCQARLDVYWETPVDHDEDGAIYEAECPTHGKLLVQDMREED